jgi:hypothetical protein
VLAGAHVPYGSSRGEEEALLAEDPSLATNVVDLGPVSEAARAWLYERARAVVYPTLYEGFGLVPFEAARAGVPCLYAPQASLPELAGTDGATLVPWDADASAEAVAALLHDEAARDRHLTLLRQGIARAGWPDVVARVTESYRLAIKAPFRAAAPRAWQELEREALIAELGRSVERTYRAWADLKASVAFAYPLAAEEGPLTRAEQRGLMRVASRAPLRRVLLSPFGALGRVRAGAGSPPAGAAPDGQDVSPSAERPAGDEPAARW